MIHPRNSTNASAAAALLIALTAVQSPLAARGFQPRRSPPTFVGRPSSSSSPGAGTPDRGGISAAPPGEGADDGDIEGLHTYVEGLSFYGDREAEVLAMGGDPFFLADEDEEETADDEGGVDSPSPAFLAMAGALDAVAAGGATERYATDGLGPTTRGDPPAPHAAPEEDEWDGWAIEDAHFDD